MAIFASCISSEPRAAHFRYECLKFAARGSLEIQDAKIRHQRTIVQICWAISSQLRHVSTIEKKLVKQQYISHMSLQYGELRPTNG